MVLFSQFFMIVSIFVPVDYLVFYALFLSNT